MHVVAIKENHVFYADFGVLKGKKIIYVKWLIYEGRGLIVTSTSYFFFLRKYSRCSAFALK